MSPLRSWLSLAALLFAVAVSASVQWETLPSLYVPWMPAFWGVAALIGAVAWRLSSGAVQTDIAADKQRVEPTLRTPVVGAALLCLSAGLIMLFRDLLSGVGTALWAIGCAGLPAAFAWAERAARQKASRPRTTRSNWRFALLVVLAVALAVRLYQLDDIPTKYLDDEGAVSDWGLSYLHGTPVIGQNTAAPLTLFRNGTTAYPLLGSVVHALVMQVAGETIFGSRLTAVLAGVACVAFLYALLLEEVPQWAALATAFLFAFCHTHLFWSRSGIPQSLTTATIAGFFWLTLRGLRNGSYAAITTAGLLLGLAQYFYEGARFFAFVLIAFLLITAALEKNFVRRRWLHLALMAMMSALVFAPIGFWYLQNPNELLARSSGVFIFAHPDYIASRYPGLDTTGVILAQLRRAFEGFAYRGDGSDFFSLRGPILDPVARTLLITGIFATIALRDRLRLLTALWIWIPIAIVCVPTVDPPSMTRLIQVVPALYVVVGLVLARIGRVMWSAAGRPGAVLLFFAIAAAFAYAVDWNLSEFFVRYPAQQVADAQTVGAKLIAQAKPDDVIRILSGFSFYAPSVRFLAHGRAGEDLPHNAIPLPGRLGHDSLVIVSSNATEQIESLRATYPDAVEAEHRNSRGDLLLHSFRISAASMNAAAGADAAWRLPDASIGMRGNRLGEFAYPRAIAADGNGRLYVADTKNQRIEVFDAHGNGLFEFGGKETGASAIGVPVALVFTNDGTLLALGTDPIAIKRYDPDGKWLGDIVVHDNISQPVAIASAPNGFYLLDQGRDEVLMVGDDGNVIARAGERGKGPLQFQSPVAIAADAKGTVFIFDKGNHRIQRLSPQLEYETEWPLDLGDERLGQVLAVGPAASERVYVANPPVGAAQRFRPDGTLEWLVGLKGDYPGDLSWPTAVAVDQAGNVYIYDENRSQIFRYDLSREPHA